MAPTEKFLFWDKNWEAWGEGQYNIGQKGHVAQARQNIGCWLPNHPTTQDCKEDPFDWKVFSSLTSSQRLLFSTKEMRIQRELSHKTESR